MSKSFLEDAEELDGSLSINSKVLQHHLQQTTKSHKTYFV